MENQKSANLLDLMSGEDAARAKNNARIREINREEPVTPEWMLVAELGVCYGWGAIDAFLNDVITGAQANMLVQGARKIHSSKVYDQAVSTAAGNSNKKNFMKIMKPYMKDMKVAQ